MDKLKPKIKLFNTFKYFYTDNYPKQKLNRGRWSYDEHIKLLNLLCILEKTIVLFKKKFLLEIQNK